MFGLIGNGTQSIRIQKILRQKKIRFCVYKPKSNNSESIGDIKRLSKCKGIFILSPNNSHIKYLKMFSNKYIFCEKPPVSKKRDLVFLKKMNYKKIFFNFNYRFSIVGEVLKLRNKFNLGKLIYGNIINSHGLTYKKNYKKNWRANKKSNPTGIFETVQIHFIDLINMFFDIKNIDKISLLNKSGIGQTPDTAHSQIHTRCGGVINIFSTYRSCLVSKKIFCFENGLIEQDENNVFIKGPAYNLNRKGFFKTPKIIKNYKISNLKDYNLSLEKSVVYFLRLCKKNKNIEKRFFSKSISTTEFLMNRNSR